MLGSLFDFPDISLWEYEEPYHGGGNWIVQKDMSVSTYGFLPICEMQLCSDKILIAR